MGENEQMALSRQQRFEQIALPHSRSLLRFALRLVNDRTEAEDLTQQALLQAWRGFDGFREGTDARAWLFRILLNTFYAQGRKLRGAPVMIPITLQEEERTIPAASSSTLGAMEVMQAFRLLSLEHQSVLHLNVVEGFTCREIAEILSLPFGTVMSRLSRGRQALRERLTGESPRLCDSTTETGMKKRR